MQGLKNELLDRTRNPDSAAQLSGFLRSVRQGASDTGHQIERLWTWANTMPFRCRGGNGQSSLGDRQPTVILEPLGDQPIVLAATCPRAVRAEVKVLAVDRNDGLVRRPMFSIFWRRVRKTWHDACPPLLRLQNGMYRFALRVTGRTADVGQVLKSKFGNNLEQVGDTRLELVTSAV